MHDDQAKWSQVGAQQTLEGEFGSTYGDERFRPVLRQIFDYVIMLQREVFGRQDAIEAKVAALSRAIDLEPFKQSSPYVRPRDAEDVTEFSDMKSGIEHADRNIGLLIKAVSNDDEVEAHGHWVSLKADLAALRHQKSFEQERRFAFGYLHDALRFTRFADLPTDGLPVLRRVLAIAGKSQVCDSDLSTISRDLETAGFELAPQ